MTTNTKPVDKATVMSLKVPQEMALRPLFERWKSGDRDEFCILSVQEA